MVSRIHQLLPRTRRGFINVARHYASPAVAVPPAINEPILSFPPGSQERKNVEKALADLKGEVADIPCIIGGQEVRTGNIREQLCPYDHRRVVARYHLAGKEQIQQGIDSALKAREEWEARPFEDRAAIFLRLANLLATKYRYDAIATTMIGQGKTVLQAEIDATCELIDFYRFAVEYALNIYKIHTEHHSPNVWNRIEQRGLEGFIAAITPFNFTAIGGNLSLTPTIMGNVCVWKPSSTAVLSNWTIFKMAEEAGIPPGVCNFLPSTGPDFGDTITSSPHLAGVSFTGGTDTFFRLWKQVATNVERFRTFPRLIGECGGKNFHLIHNTADLENVAYCSVRGAFEYSGQKCSATARVYVPESCWPELRDRMVAIVKEMKCGSAEDYTSFTSAVIDHKSWKNIKGYLDFAHSSNETKVLVGGGADDSEGYFIEPTIIETSNPKNKLMEEEIFGPVMTCYVYPDNKADEILELIDTTSPYALTGAVFANDRSYISKVMRVLRQTSGNFYINDKCTGSVVGQQPFGGARLSGTNDKAGSAAFLARWSSPLSIKETTIPYTDWSYPSVDKN